MAGILRLRFLAHRLANRMRKYLAIQGLSNLPGGAFDASLAAAIHAAEPAICPYRQPPCSFIWTSSQAPIEGT